MVFPVSTFVVYLVPSKLIFWIACIFTASIPRALRIAKHLDAGNVNINTSQVFGPNVPFGGAKQSGLGREGGRQGLMNYVEAKTISIK